MGFCIWRVQNLDTDGARIVQCILERIVPGLLAAIGYLALFFPIVRMVGQRKGKEEWRWGKGGVPQEDRPEMQTGEGFSPRLVTGVGENTD